MKILKATLLLIATAYFLNCGGSSGSSQDYLPPSSLPPPTTGLLKGTLNIDLEPYFNDGFWYGDCSHWFIDVVMTGNQTCSDYVSIYQNEFGHDDWWNNGETTYREFSCTLLPGTYLVEIKANQDYGYLNWCSDSPKIYYTIDTYYGYFQVTAGQTTQLLPVTVVPYQML